jgi:opacity protein-like surface antigen
MKKVCGLVLTTVLISAAIARAQPPPDGQGGDGSGSGTQIGSDGATGDQPLTGVPPTGPEQPADPYANQPAVETPKHPVTPRGPINMPEVLTTPTGWLLPAAVIYSRTSIDTGGGVTSDSRVGLGDVAEFGLATTDAVREKMTLQDKQVDRIQPYVTASFRLGVSEDRLFENQPGITLGFRKSFERNHDGFRTRIAELTLVASKHLGKNTAIHVGGAFWDASLAGAIDGDPENRREMTLHDGELKNQIKVFGGIEVRPLPRSQILVDLGWSPEFCYYCSQDSDKIKLRPTLSWGVRYAVADFMNLESGVRVPDIASANLLDAQIFGQVTFTSWALRRAVDSLK